MNVEVEFKTADIAGILTADDKIALYRIVQEALTNIARHAQASSVEVRLERKKSTVSVLIIDDGNGFEVDRITDPPSFLVGAGLFDMRERAASLQGNFSIHSQPGQGTRVEVKIPLHE